ncbi:sugar transferase [Azospirillum sp.]|uniref:sugar transferase n=1 Tax=Azospirillum sp. TaxID=34012 RepID=UPI002D3B7B5C|nr:sugar transferase [Azospirillum sp.]HYF89367.1 sugar transferase [Azospirillum sp.]
MALSNIALLGAPRLDPGRMAGTRSAMQAMDRLPGCPPLHRHRVKRAFDIVGSLGLLAIFGPLMLVLAWMVARDGGPAVFGHRRIGADGRSFTCLKFRSMVVNSAEVLERLLATDETARTEWLATRKLRNDPRITPVGRFLRKSSLDELPQLINVLRGDMSLVGPRPIIDDEVPYYRACFPFYTRCRPGLTGLWQVSGRSDVDYVRRVQLDTAYVVGWSFWADIGIMLRTVRVVVKGSGAY